MQKKGLSRSDLITRKTSILLNVSEDIIEKVMSFEKKSSREALSSCNSVEISNLCVFHLRDKKLKEEIFKFNKIKDSYLRKLEASTDEEEKRKINVILKNIDIDLEYLNNKTKCQ